MRPTTPSSGSNAYGTLVSDPDIIAARREYATEAIDGALTQLEAAARFLSRGHDEYAAAAFARGLEFVRLAAPEIRTLVPKVEGEPAAGREAA